jgi:hypothetical protein
MQGARMEEEPKGTKAREPRERGNGANLPACSLWKIGKLHTERSTPGTRMRAILSRKGIARTSPTRKLDSQAASFQVGAILRTTISQRFEAKQCGEGGLRKAKKNGRWLARAPDLRGIIAHTWNDIRGIHGIFELDETKAIHELDLGDFAMAFEMLRDVFLGYWTRVWTSARARSSSPSWHRPR